MNLACWLATASGTNLDALACVRTETLSTRARARTTPRARVKAPCSCCGSRFEHLAARHTQFCADCLERAGAYDASDPYDELGEGD